jgi:hypothetical protein
LKGKKNGDDETVSSDVTTSSKNDTPSNDSKLSLSEEKKKKLTVLSFDLSIHQSILHFDFNFVSSMWYIYL